MTAVPVHTVIRTPGSSTPASHAGPATPHPPGSPQNDPGTPTNQQHPQQDSLQDIRADLDHYPGGLTDPDPADQQALADAVPHNEDGTPERFPDPFGSWSQLQNDGGNTVPGRSNNCADCSRSFLETWYGNPQVSAPRTPDTDEHGNPDPFAPESNANENQIRWTGAAHTYAGPGNDPDTANNIASVLQQSGPGSAAIVQVDWPGGGGHAFNVVNHNGNIVWIDTQSGDVSNQPLHIDNAAHVWHIPLDANRNPIDLTQSDADDSESQNDESQHQNGDAAQPENSENDGQPENSQSPQNEGASDSPKQGDDTDTDTDSPKATNLATPDASNASDPAQPSTADPDSTPDPTNGKPENESGQPQSESNTPSEPDSTPDGRESSQDTPETRQPSPDDSNTDPQQSPETPSEQNRPSPAETPSTSDQQSRPDEATRPDEQGRTPDKESEQPTVTTESPARPNSPSEHRQPPTDTTPDNADNGTPDKATTPTRTASDTPNDPTTNRDTPQQTTTPPDPRASDPHRETPTQKKSETNERPDGQRPNTLPRPDQTRPDHLDDPRSETPNKDQSETPDQTRPDDPNQSAADHHRDRPSNMNKDSAVPSRENLPDGKNADAASYVKDSTRGKDPLYGPIAGETNTGNTRPDSDGTTPPHRPAEPAARNNEDDKAFIRRMVDFANESRENRELYWRKDGQRKSLVDKIDGRELPQLKRDPDYPDDEDKFIAASDVPPPVQPDYMPEETHPPVDLGRDEGRIMPENLTDLDVETNDREWTLQADRIAETAKLKAKEDQGEDSEEYKAAKRVYSDTHSAVRDIGESHGENAALHHAMASQHPEYVLVDVPRTGNGSDQFDQIYEDTNNPGHYIVVEAKAPTGQLGPRTGHTGQKVMQGTREYFETIYMLMQDGTPEQKAIADKLETAYELGNVQYVLVQSKVETDPEANEAANNGNTDGGYVGDEGPRERKRYGGFTMEYFDIRKPEDGQE